MTMQRRHFELIAETIRFSDLPDDCRNKVAAEFAAALKRTNPNFNRDRFLTACGATEQA